MYSVCGYKTCSQKKNFFSPKCRQFCRRPRKTWFGSKSFNLVEPAHVGPRRSIPHSIKKPSYAESGVETELSDHIEIQDNDFLAHMRQSCSLAKTVLDQVGKNVKVGISTDDLDAIAHVTCVHFGAYPSPLNYRGFPKSICTSVNNVACHGIPDSRKLQNGDIISIDVSVYYEGFHGDCAATYCVGDVDKNGRRLVETASLCLEEAIKICHHGQPFCSIGKTISKFVEDRGFSVVPVFCGHGIGCKFHCPPSILHYDNDEDGIMKKGMIFTIEPVICDGQPDILILEDGWTATTEDNSRSAQFEQTILVTEDGAQILTVPGAYICDQ